MSAVRESPCALSPPLRSGKWKCLLQFNITHTEKWSPYGHENPNSAKHHRPGDGVAEQCFAVWRVSVQLGDQHDQIPDDNHNTAGRGTPNQRYASFEGVPLTLRLGIAG